MNDHLKKVAIHHDWWAKTYDFDYFGRFALYHKVTLDNINRFVPKEKGAIILDAGGGTGIWSIELAKRGHSVVLTDISKGMLEKAKRKIKALGLESQIEVKISDICNMPEFSDNYFAMILCEGDPLSYCGDHNLKFGGIIVASVDNRASALSWLSEKKDQNEVERLLEKGDIVIPQEREEFRYIIHAFTPEELKGLFTSNGLVVERLIGKLVVAHRLPWFKSKDPSIQEWLLNLELKYNENPTFYPWAGHLEIVGRKKL